MTLLANRHLEHTRSQAPAWERTVLEASPPAVGDPTLLRQAESASHWVTRLRLGTSCGIRLWLLARSVDLLARTHFGIKALATTCAWLLAGFTSIAAAQSTNSSKPAPNRWRDLPPLITPSQSLPASIETANAPAAHASPWILVSEPPQGDALADLALPQVPDALAPTPSASKLGTGAFPSATAPIASKNNTNVTSGTKAETTIPQFELPASKPIQADCCVREVPFAGSDFLPTPINPEPADPCVESLIYRGKYPLPVQRPWVELGRPMYTSGIYPPAGTFFGETNLSAPHFYVYGDMRTGVGVHQNKGGVAQRSWATRLNLDMDLKLTSTERFHAFMGPLDRNNDVTRLDFSDRQNIEFVDRTDLRFDTLFFEGDLGAILGGREGTYAPFDLPFTLGLIPLVYQNGIWMEDAMLGAAFAIPARNSPLLHWSNYEASFFALTDQVTTDAFRGDNNAAEVFGTAWFVEAYDGYIEADYAFIHDDVGGHRSYHNASIGFTRRYLSRLSNSVRYITNFNQALPRDQRTADGYLFLVENSLISSQPNTFVPYANLFYGSGRPQSVARAAVAGGVLRNTGINFETDNLTNYPTLDPTGNNTYGAAFGVNMLGSNFSHQLVLEMAALAATGNPQFRSAPGDQYAFGVRYQKPLSHRWIFRTDSMYGWLRESDDIFGNRIEFRWKF